MLNLFCFFKPTSAQVACDTPCLNVNYYIGNHFFYI